MMKRVSLCRFKTSVISRKVQQGSRGGEGVNANGGACPCDDQCATEEADYDGKQVALNQNFLKDKTSNENHRIKGSILKTIRWKWRKSKRSKRPEGRSRNESHLNLGQPHIESTEQGRSIFLKHPRIKKQKSGVKSSICPMRSPVQCIQRATGSCETENKETKWNCQNLDQTQLEASSCVNEENHDCSCFGSPSRKTRCSAAKSFIVKSSKLQTSTSCSLSDVSSSANANCSSPLTENEPLNDICRISSLVETVDNGNSCAYSNALCVTSGVSIDSAVKTSSSNSLHGIPKVGNLTQELYKLSKYGWYWGPINRSEAESKLIDQPDGAFLVRDSSDDRYILSLSFRSYGKTLHTRIEHSSGLFSFYSQPEPEGHASIVELIKQSMSYSQSGVFCYSRSRSPGSPSFPVRLTKPISRFTQVRSLQYLCRFVIRQYTRFDHIQKLPLPARIKGYLEEGHY